MNITIPDEVFKAALRDAVLKTISDLDMEAITLLDVKQTAERLGVCTKTVYELPIERVELGGKCIRWSLKAIKDYITSRTIKVCR